MRVVAEPKQEVMITADAGRDSSSLLEKHALFLFAMLDLVSITKASSV